MAAPRRPLGPLEVFRPSPGAASRALVIVGPFTTLLGVVIAFAFGLSRVAREEKAAETM